MKSWICFSLIVFLTFICGTVAIAQVGSIEEAIAAAIDDKEPDYIVDYGVQLSEKFHQFIKRRKIKSPKQMLALFLSMKAIFRETRTVTSDAASHAIQDAAFDAAWGDSSHTSPILLKIRWKGSWQSAYVSTRYAALNAFNKDLDIIVIERIARRVAEFENLNFIIQNLGRILHRQYNMALNSMPEHPQNPFVTIETWRPFRDRILCQLEPEATIFSLPWLNVFNELMEGSAHGVADNNLVTPSPNMLSPQVFNFVGL